MPHYEDRSIKSRGRSGVSLYLVRTAVGYTGENDGAYTHIEFVPIVFVTLLLLDVLVRVAMLGGRGGRCERAATALKRV
jgi:hypothetical protein